MTKFFLKSVIFSFVFTLFLVFGFLIVKGWDADLKASSGDTLTMAKWNEMIDKIDAAKPMNWTCIEKFEQCDNSASCNVTCDAGYRAISGGCDSSGPGRNLVRVGIDDMTTSWTCQSNATTTFVRARAICCK